MYHNHMKNFHHLRGEEGQLKVCVSTRTTSEMTPFVVQSGNAPSTN